MAGDGSDQDTLTEGRPNRNPADDQPYGDPPDDLENLLSLPDRKAAELNYRLWKSQPKEQQQRRRAEWLVNTWRREGRSNVYVQKVQDKGVWQAWEPPWTAPPIPVLNKADRLCRRLVNMSFADPPEPDAEPSTSEEEDIEASRFQVQLLKNIQSEANLDDIRAHRRAFDRASVYGSGFIRYYIDQRGGGRQAVRIMAKKAAVSAKAPFVGPAGEPLEGELVARYVTEDGTLQDTPAGAATQWVASLKKEILQASSIRFLPHDSEDIWDAEGLIIGTMPTWGELEDLWPEEMAAISKEDKAKILAFKPEHRQDLLGLDTASKKDLTPENDRDKRVAVFTTYYKACPTYPDGCYFIGLGDIVKLHGQTWVYEPEDGDREELEIPVTQHMQFDPGRPDPFKLGLMQILGGASELRASQVGHLIQYLDQFAGRRTFLPTNSIIQPKQLQLMQGATIPMNPGGKPEYEEIPAFPSAPMELYALVSEEMDDHSMMKETAQGTDVPSVQSGRQASIIIQQAMASLSEIRQNIERAYIRACRIQAQQIRMGYTVPQQISWTGEDGQYRQKWWSGSDLRGTADFKLKQGSLSMMTPEQKMNLAIQFKQLGVYDQYPDLFYDALTNSMGPVAGLEEDPARARIKRQLAAWSMGPPQGWVEKKQAEAAQMAMALPAGPGVAPGNPQMAAGVPGPASMGGPDAGVLAAGEPSGTPVPAGPPPMDPAIAAIFEPVKADEIQDVAAIRLTELKRFMASVRFTRWPPEWRQGVEQEFDHMKLCAGVVTIPEQQQAAQQQADQAKADATALEEQKFQHQLELEKFKVESHPPTNGNGKGGGKPLDLKIDRDPTGRAARLREEGPPPAGVQQ